MNNTEIIVATDNFLDMDPFVPPSQELVPANTDPVDINSDFDLSRNNIVNLLKKGETALEALGDMAAVTQDPEAYAALASIMKTMVSASEKLMHLHKQKQDLIANDKELNPVNINNSNVIVMTTAEMAKWIKSAANGKT